VREYVKGCNPRVQELIKRGNGYNYLNFRSLDGFLPPLCCIPSSTKNVVFEFYLNISVIP
jgi:hypothetical protein